MAVRKRSLFLRDLDHDMRKREYRWRQFELLSLAFIWGVGAAFTDIVGLKALGATLALVMIQQATQEAKRMRACGRYYQTKRSVEVLGF